MITSTLHPCRDQWSNPLFSPMLICMKRVMVIAVSFQLGKESKRCTHSFRLLSYKSSSWVGAADPDHPLFPSFLCPFCLPPPMVRFQHTSFLTSSYRKSFRPSQHFSAPMLPSSLMPFLLLLVTIPSYLTSRHFLGFFLTFSRAVAVLFSWRQNALGLNEVLVNESREVTPVEF